MSRRSKVSKHCKKCGMITFWGKYCAACTYDKEQIAKAVKKERQRIVKWIRQRPKARDCKSKEIWFEYCVSEDALSALEKGEMK